MYLSFFITTTSGHNDQKWKGRKNEWKKWKEVIDCGCSGGSCRKGSEGCQKGKKQEEELRSALDDFYEEELNWWDREHEKGDEL